MNVCLYSPQQEEKIFIRKQARTWQRSGLINDSQLTTMLDFTNPNVRQTNVFFRIIFFVFTILCIGALFGLYFLISGINKPVPAAFTFIVASIILYFVAEYITAHYRFYRYGIEEAFAMIAVALLCVGCGIVMDEMILNNQASGIFVTLMLTVCAWWIYLRFGFLYAAFISIMALCTLPFQLSLTPLSERLFLLVLLCLILLINVILDKPDNADFRKEKDITIQACLLAAVYLTANLEILGAIGLLTGVTNNIHLHPKSFPPYIYWSSYILTFIIPAAGIYRGIKSRKRLILNISLIMACVTMATNKSYLGMTRYAWDPAILGTALVILSIMIHHWLDGGTNKARNGYTAENILKPESHGIGFAEFAAAVTPVATGIDIQGSPAQQEKYFNGGSSGGGGTARDF